MNKIKDNVGYENVSYFFSIIIVIYKISLWNYHLRVHFLNKIEVFKKSKNQCQKKTFLKKF
jgi:hypothetical protein